MQQSFLALSFILAGVSLAAACSEASDWSLGPEGNAFATRTERSNEWLPFQWPTSITPAPPPMRRSIWKERSMVKEASGTTSISSRTTT